MSWAAWCGRWRLRRSAPLAGGDAAALACLGAIARPDALRLLEMLKVIEVDGERDEAILRSDTPAAKGEDRFYYEVHLQGPARPRCAATRGSLTVTGKREQVAFALTHEALARLAADLAAEK